jgi:phosphoribosylformylglycinamidine cyclo-ligase
MAKDKSRPDLYKQAGVDVEKGDQLVDWLAENRETVANPYVSVLDGIGGFAGIVRPNWKRFEDPLLIGCTDGVGTKILLALQHKNVSGLGIDLVAMCVNDMYCVGGRPLFFLDYYATGALDSNDFKSVLTGIKAGLKQCSCPLLGGETAELPGMYPKGEFDLAGFMVGIVDGKTMLTPSLIEDGDLIYGLKSSGFHSNGYSLIRKWLQERPANVELIEHLLEPTAIYSEIPDLLDELPKGTIHGIAHITGGGISGNLPRVLPKGATAVLDPQRIPTPEWMSQFIYAGGYAPLDLEGTFNLGVGMCLIVGKNQRHDFEKSASKLPRIIGPFGRVQLSETAQDPKVSFESHLEF